MGKYRSYMGEELLEASAHGDIKRIALLTQAGAYVNYDFSGQFTPLSAAAEENQRGAVCFLVLKGADPLQADSDGRLPIRR